MVVYTEPTPRFTPGQCWSFKNNAICGICLGAWTRLLWRYRAHVEWTRYWQRVLFIFAISTFNSLLGWVEVALYGRAIAKQKIHPRPLFVLGHPRTGTTMLQNLLAKDKTFGACSTFCAGFPSAFLWFEPFRCIFAGAVDKTRPMDNMELSFDGPQEDELAVSVLTAGVSPYMPLTFMTAEPAFRPYFSFRDAPPAETQTWVDAFLYLLRKARAHL